MIMIVARVDCICYSRLGENGKNITPPTTVVSLKFYVIYARFNIFDDERAPSTV